MITMNIAASETQYKSRLPLKLILLFLAGFLAVVIGGIVMDVFSGLFESQKAQSDMAVQQPAVVIDPKLESDLAKVMNLENNQNTADLKDPFTDRTGISQTGNAATGSVARTTSSTTTDSTTQTTAKTVAVASTKGKTTQSGAGNVQNSGVANNVVVKEDTVTRILKRDENIRNGIPVGPESEVFAIEDLLPVGVVSGGNGQEELLLYSQSADRTYSFPVGTRFYDGWLSGIRGEGAVFSFTGTNQTRLKSWVRSIQTKSSTTSAIDSPNQSMTSGGN